MPSDSGQRVAPQAICLRAFELLRAHQTDDAEKLLANNLAKADEPVAIGLLHSALGVVERVRGNAKAALRHYERAERVLADDPALKLITARLLIDQFREYDAAIRRCRKALKLLPDNPVVVHHAYTVMGLAQVGAGRRAAALECLEQSMAGQFKNFVTAENIDFHLVEACARKRWGIDRCAQFLQLAKKLAEGAGEGHWLRTISQIIGALELAQAPANVV